MHYLTCTLNFYLGPNPSANIEEAGFMTCTTSSHQGAIRIFCLHFWGVDIIIHQYYTSMVDTHPVTLLIITSVLGNIRKPVLNPY